MRPLRSEYVTSPSLASRTDVQPYELKFLVDGSLAARAADRARDFLAEDPFGEPALDGAYETTTLYLDTPDLDVFHRRPSYRRRKYRVRRYGVAMWVCLERKTRSQDRVRKRRTQVPEGDLRILERGDAELDWPGYWFHQRVEVRRLMPAALVTYRRTAFNGQTPEGPLRLTIDRQIRGAQTRSWRVEPVEGGAPILPGRAILELKFFDAMPAAFRRLIADLGLCAAAVSKYRLCREAHGEAPEVPRA